MLHIYSTEKHAYDSRDLITIGVGGCFAHRNTTLIDSAPPYLLYVKLLKVVFSFSILRGLAPAS